MLPKPYPGMTISYGFLWPEEFEEGQDTPLKVRPCLILHAEAVGDRYRVTVCPITHSPQGESTVPKVPANYIREAGLDGHDSYVIVRSTNQFIWSSRDVRDVRGRLPEGSFMTILNRYKIDKANNAVRNVDRDKMDDDIVSAYRRKRDRDM